MRDLTPEERAAIDRALRGYLRDLEEAYEAGLRADFPMFPTGRLKWDVAPSRRSRKKRSHDNSPELDARVLIRESSQNDEADGILNVVLGDAMRDVWIAKRGGVPVALPRNDEGSGVVI
jgi:hypothetical protein